MSDDKMYDEQKQNEVLNSMVRTDGVGEDPAVKAILSDDFVNADDVTALGIANALMQIARGVQTQGEQLAKLTERFDKMERARAAEQKDRQKFIEDISNYADNLRLPDAQRAALQAKEASNMGKRVAMAKAKAATNQAEVRARLKSEPQVEITAPGEFILTGRPPNVQPRLLPTTINLYGLAYRLEPGIPTKVPQSVAKRFYDMQRMKAENQARKDILSADRPKLMKDEELAANWQKINDEYGAPAEPIILASNA